MIDLHCHLLPGIDDGPVDLAESLAYARSAADAGVRTIVATPHLHPDHPGVRPERIGSAVTALNAALDEHAIALTVLPGGELDLSWALEADDAALGAVSLGGYGTDLLVETPYGELPHRFEDLLFRLSVRGFRLLLAHPERSVTFHRDPRRLGALVDRGTLVQVTASALARPDRRSRSRRFALDLVKEGRAHVIATDAHGFRILRPSLAEGVAAAAAVAPARGRWMATDAPAAILAGAALPTAPAVPPRRRRLLLGR